MRMIYDKQANGARLSEKVKTFLADKDDHILSYTSTVLRVLCLLPDYY
jgi:hypothetical protein